MITIHAGQGLEMLAVHTKVLLASGSPSLSSLLYSKCRESHHDPVDETIDWKHIDAETARRVLTFLYLQDYPVPGPVSRGDCSDSESSLSDIPGEVLQEDETPTIEHDNDDGAGDNDGNNTGVNDGIDADVDINTDVSANGTDGVDDMNTDDTTTPTDPLHSPAWPFMLDYMEPGNGTSLRLRTASCFEDHPFPFAEYSYIDILLAHAQVYIVARSYHLNELQDLAVHRMSQTLNKVDCSIPHATDELSDLVEYVYNVTDTGEDSADRMQLLVSQFCAIKYRFLFRGRFKDLVCQGVNFTRDVLKGVSMYTSLQSEVTTSRLNPTSRLVRNLGTALRRRNQIIDRLQNELEYVWTYSMDSLMTS